MRRMMMKMMTLTTWGMGESFLFFSLLLNMFLVLQKLQQTAIPKNAQSGHIENMNAVCPGSDIEPRLFLLRTKVLSHRNGTLWMWFAR